MSDVMDVDASWEYAKSYVDNQVKAGKMTREKARKVLDDARKNFREQTYNRTMERLKR